MRLIQLSFLTALFGIIKGYQLAPFHETECPIKLPFKIRLQTVLLDVDGTSDPDMKTCLLKNINDNQVALLINGHNTQSNVMLEKHKAIHDPNVIIMVKNVTPLVLEAPSVKRVLKFPHAAVVFVVSDATRFKCTDGALNKSDFQAVEFFMNKVWQKHSIAHVGTIFPLSCKEKIVLYTNIKLNKNQVLFDRTVNLIDITNTKAFYAAAMQSAHLLTEDYPLRASIFPRYPTSITDCENLHYYTHVNLTLTEGYCGLDALVMHEIVKHFKFKLYFPRDEYCDKYGYVAVAPNNITGSIGCIVRKELDISFNSRFLTQYSEDYVYFLHYVTTDSLCILLKRAEVIPIWQYVTTIYDIKLILLIMSSVVAIGLFMWATALVKNKTTGDEKEPFFIYTVDAFTTTMLGFSLKKKRNSCILRGICLCCSIMFLTIYQGHINHMFTTLIRFDGIKTLDGLYKSDRTLFLTPGMRELLRQIQNPENKAQSDFLRRICLVEKNHSPDFILSHPCAALLGRKQDSVIEIFGNYTDEYDKPLIDIVDECFYTYYLSYIAQSDFPFYEEMQRFMQRLTEAGLPFIYYRWTCNMLHVPSSLPKIRSEPRRFMKIQLKNERVAFFVLIFGQIVSLIAFTVELWRGKRGRNFGS